MLSTRLLFWSVCETDSLSTMMFHEREPNIFYLIMILCIFDILSFDFYVVKELCAGANIELASWIEIIVFLRVGILFIGLELCPKLNWFKLFIRLEYLMRLCAGARMLLASSTTRFVFRRAISLDCLEFNCWLLQSLLELTLNSFFVDCFLNLYITVAAFINWITIWKFVWLQQLYDGAVSCSPVGCWS